MGMTDAEANANLEALFAASVWLALSTADPGTDGTGLSEPSGGSYDRVEIETGDWTAAAARAKSNAVAVAFPSPSGNWGTITHVALMDAGSGGNVKWSTPLALSQSVTATSAPPTFDIGKITVTQT